MEWNGPALDRELNMLYVNAVDWCTKFTMAETVRHIPGRLYMGGTFEFAAESQGWLTAMDASTGVVKWKYQITTSAASTKRCASRPRWKLG